MSNISAVLAETPLIYLAPMAGITDLPFRDLVSSYGVGQVVSEMIASENIKFEISGISKRLSFSKKFKNSIVQLAGCDAYWMAEAAKYAESFGCDAIDINMGCPAKKVCKRAAGSALLQYPELVSDILKATVSAVDVPVTLKIRTGWDRQNRNAVTIAKIAEEAGIASLAVHGRTKACRFVGEVEYDTIAQVVEAVSIPVLANGDIECIFAKSRVEVSQVPTV